MQRARDSTNQSEGVRVSPNQRYSPGMQRAVPLTVRRGVDSMSVWDIRRWHQPSVEVSTNRNRPPACYARYCWRYKRRVPSFLVLSFNDTVPTARRFVSEIAKHIVEHSKNTSVSWPWLKWHFDVVWFNGIWRWRQLAVDGSTNHTITMNKCTKCGQAVITHGHSSRCAPKPFVCTTCKSLFGREWDLARHTKRWGVGDHRNPCRRLNARKSCINMSCYPMVWLPTCLGPWKEDGTMLQRVGSSPGSISTLPPTNLSGEGEMFKKPECTQRSCPTCGVSKIDDLCGTTNTSWGHHRCVLVPLGNDCYEHISKAKNWTGKSR